MTTSSEEKVTLTEIFLTYPYYTDAIDNEISADKKGLTTIPIGVSESFFHDRLRHIAGKNSPYRFFQRTFKSYVYEDLFLENCDTKEGQTFTVYSKKMKHYAFEKDKGLLHVGYHKKKLPFNAFPSTTKLNNIFLTKRLSFLANSSIYLNFDIVYHMNKDKVIDENAPTYKIFVNVNTDKNIDLQNARALTREVFAFLLD